MTPRARSFGAAADDYDRLRPAPGPEALRWLVPATDAAVLDLGAGTGLISRALAAEGVADVVAVEPDDAMRAVLLGRSPGARALAGTAEAIPLPDASLDAVLVGSAWHWFDPERATAEIARVLRPEGVLGLVWTYYDPRESWVGELRGIGGLDEGGEAPAVDADFVVELPAGAPFGVGETAVFRHGTWMAADDVAAAIGTHSAVLVRPAAERAEIHRRAREHVARAVGTDPVLVPFVTAVWRAVRTSG